MTPFATQYAPRSHLDRYWNGRTPLDYTHEREWWVPHDFHFELQEVQFVTVRSYEDVARFPTDIKDAIGRDKFLLLDVYEQIETLWPTHVL